MWCGKLLVAPFIAPPFSLGASEYPRMAPCTALESQLSHFPTRTWPGRPVKTRYSASDIGPSAARGAPHSAGAMGHLGVMTFLTAKSSYAELEGKGCLVSPKNPWVVALWATVYQEIKIYEVVSSTATNAEVHNIHRESISQKHQRFGYAEDELSIFSMGEIIWPPTPTLKNSQRTC